MKLWEIIRTAASEVYLIGKLGLLPTGEIIDYVNPKHKNYIRWNLCALGGIALEILSFYNIIFLPIGLIVLLVYLFSKDRKISYCLESLEKACKVGNTKLIKHYKLKAERLVNGE